MVQNYKYKLKSWIRSLAIMLRQLCSGKISFIELIPWDYSVKLFFFAFHTQMAKNCRIFQVKVEHLAAIITNTMLTKDL